MAEAPLKSLRSDLGLAARGASSSSYGLALGLGGSPPTSATLRARMRKLEAAMVQLQEQVQTQSQDMVAGAVAFARPDQRAFIQNTVTAAIHKAKLNDDGSTMCGWRFVGARKKGAGSPYRVVHSISGMPSTMICERCMPTERAIAAMVGIAGAEDISGDEFEFTKLIRRPSLDMCYSLCETFIVQSWSPKFVNINSLYKSVAPN